jgi:hypothetical protein
MTFLRVPFGLRPPAPSPAGLIQAELEQPPQGQGHQLPREGAQPRFLGPRPACCQAEALGVVTAAVVLANTCGTRLHDLGGRQIQGRRDQAPGRSGPRHRDGADMHGDCRPPDRPPAPPLLVPARASPAIAPRPAGSPRGGPVHVVWRGREPLTPRRPTPLRPRSGHHRGVEPCLAPQARQPRHLPFPWRRVQAGFDHRRDGVGPSTYAPDRRTRLGLRWPQPLHRPGRCGLHGLARRHLVLPTIPPCRMGQLDPRRPRYHIAQAPPVVRAERLRSVGTPSPGVMTGAGAPDCGTGAVPRGLIPCDRMIAAPPDRPFRLDHPPRLPFSGVAVPSARLGNVLQHPPARRQAKRRQNWRAGMRFPAPHHPCDPRHKTPPAWPGETCRKRPQKRLPPLPPWCRFAHDAPPLLSGHHIWPSPPEGCLVGSVFARQNPRNYCIVGTPCAFARPPLATSSAGTPGTLRIKKQ